MTTDIQLLRSSVASKRPAVAPLLDGQAAININPADPGLFFKDSTGLELIKIGPVTVNTSGDAPNSNPSGSTGNAIGESWLDGRPELANPTMKVWDGLTWKASNGFEVDDATGAFEFDRLMTVRTLESDGTGADSYLRIPQDDDTARAAITANPGMIRFNTTTLVFEGYDGTSWESFALSQGNLTLVDLTATGNTILGDDCAQDTLTINSVTSINCDATIGASNANALTVESVVSSDFVPDGTGTRALGESSARWNAFLNDLSATGNTVLGDDIASDTVAVSAELTQNGETNFLNSSTMWNSQKLRFSPAITPSAAATYVSFEAPGTLTAPVSYVLPDADGTAGQVLATDGSGTLSWDNPSLAANVTVTDLTVTGNTVLGDDCSTDTLLINSSTFINCDMLIGSDSADNLTILSRISSPLIPSGDNVVDLGSAALRWANLHIDNGFVSGDLLPVADNSSNLGSIAQRWANVFTGDLHLKNDRGDWTMVEEEDYLSLRNNKTGKIFKLSMEPVD